MFAEANTLEPPILRGALLRLVRLFAAGKRPTHPLVVNC